MKSLADETRLLREVWGLEGIPFPDVPPDDAAQVARFFVGREEERAKARSILYRGENVLVRGTWGIGKTAFILATLHQLQEEARELKENVVALCIKEFRGGPASRFYQVVLEALKPKVKKNLWDRFRGLKPQELGVKVFKVIDVEAKWQAQKREKAVLDEIASIFKRAEKKRQRLAVAFDDLDKTTLQQGVINGMLRDALHILRDLRCGFILTGRAITKFDNLEILQLGVVNELISLKPLNDVELRQVAIHQLNLVRRKSRDDVFPFSDEVVGEIARKSVGIPRVFHRLCRKTIEIPPDLKRILYYAFHQNGFLISSKEETLEEVLPLVGVTTVYDLVPYLDSLAQADFMIRIERPEGIRYEIAPGTERAAEEGGQLK
jgi:hypothetical protein